MSVKDDLDRGNVRVDKFNCMRNGEDITYIIYCTGLLAGPAMFRYSGHVGLQNMSFADLISRFSQQYVFCSALLKITELNLVLYCRSWIISIL